MRDLFALAEPDAEISIGVDVPEGATVTLTISHAAAGPIVHIDSGRLAGNITVVVDGVPVTGTPKLQRTA